MLPKSDIQKYGGKAAILDYVRQNIPEMPILPYVIKEHDASIDSILSDFNAMKKPVIVRSSSPYEYGDCEGIFDSVKDVYDAFGLTRAIQQVEQSAVSERAKLYAEQNNMEMGGKMTIFVQEQSKSEYLGAMMRHPNNPDLIFIGYHDNKRKSKRDYSRFLFDEKTQTEADNRVFITRGISEDGAKFLVDKYKQIESLTKIAEGYSLFVEFGFKPFSLYQVRPFKKIETASFDIPTEKYDLWSDLCFGITPKEGIVLPVIRSIGLDEVIKIASRLGGFQNPEFEFSPREVELRRQMENAGVIYSMGKYTDREFIEHLTGALKNHNQEMNEMSEKPYCFMTSSALIEEFDVDLSLPKIKAMVVGRAENFLVHNMMRLIKKADVTFAQPLLHLEEIYQNANSLEDNVRIISNGIEAVVIKE